MSDAITYRWIEGIDATDADWSRIEEIGAARGWMELGRQTTLRVLLAERDGEIVGFCVLQMLPHLEPLFVDKSVRGTGVAEELADRMVEWMHEIKARGWMTVAEHPAAKLLCEREGMHRMDAPVYVYVRGV
jgi:GNAT superfamily N-acetyltransferase